MVLLSFNLTKSQVFWTETFGTGCNQGQIANGFVTANGAWTVSNTGTNDPYAQEWYISATEAGMGAGNCGDGCLNNTTLTNRTLHVGNIAVAALGLPADQGAAYLEGGCGFGFCSSTDKRAESPTINCTGQSNITLSFNYIQEGTAGTDYTELMYFDGVTWASLGNLPATVNGGCTPQGFWTNYSIVLPASANNNPNVKIGFRWQNIDDGVATDPSFAVDDIQLSAITSTITLTLTISPSTVCVGNTVTATANTGTTSVTGYTWSSNPSGAIFTPPNASVTTVSFSSAGTYSLNVLVSDGTNTVTATETVIVSPTPTITISSTGNTICPSGNTTLTANGANNYTWTPSSSLSSSTGSAVVASPTINTTYTVTGSNAFGCTSTETVDIVIGPPFTISVTPTSGTTCIGGSSINLTASGSAAYGSINYNWAPSSGLNTTTGPLVTASPSATTTYTVIGSAGSCTAIATTTIDVTPPPPFTVTPTNTIICEGSSTTYTATGLNSYTWSPAFTLSSSTGSIVTANPTVTTTYTVIGEDISGCMANAQVITLTVIPIPTATAILTTPLGNDSICGGTTGTLSVNTSTPPTGFAYSYTWSAPSTYSNTFLVPPNFQQVAFMPPTPNPTATIVYSVQVAYSALTTCVSAPSTVTVTVINCNPPIASFTTIPANNDTLCTGECIVLQNTSSGGQPQIIKWEIPGATPDTASGDFPQFCFPVPGDYTVFIKVTNNWGADSSLTPNYIHVVDIPNTIGVKDTSIKFNECVQLYGTQASYYSWSGPDGLICAGCTTINPCLTETTTFYITGYNSKRCKQVDTVVVKVDLDCGEMFIPSAFSPNNDGKNDILYVRGRCLKNLTLEIFNRWGEKVFETSDQNIGWDGTQNGKPLNTGVYVYKLEGTTYDNQQYIKKGNITLLR